MALVHAVEHHFGDRLLADAAFAAGFVIERLGQAAMLGQQLGAAPCLARLCGAAAGAAAYVPGAALGR